jgi:hypothetical protein
LFRFNCFLWALSFAAIASGQCQTAPEGGAVPDANLRRFEIGFVAGDAHFTNYNLTPQGPWPTVEIGLGAAMNLKPSIALETKLTMTPRQYCYDSAVCGGHALEFLLGPRAEARTRRFGLFGEVEPGFLSWSQATTAVTLTGTSPTIETDTRQRRTFFAWQLGGGLEFSPTQRVHLRAVLGDLLIHYDGSQLFTWNFPTALSCYSCKPWINNVQATAGVYWSLGKPLAWTPPDVHAIPSHRFFDKTNFTVLAVSLLGQTSDAITTQRLRSHGGVEEDPLARPLVDKGWMGQIGLAAIDNAAQLSIMYFLHRTDHHRVERLVPLLFGGASGVMGYRNEQR